jgi:hypothetical protein
VKKLIKVIYNLFYIILLIFLVYDDLQAAAERLRKLNEKTNKKIKQLMKESKMYLYN